MSGPLGMLGYLLQRDAAVRQSVAKRCCSAANQRSAEATEAPPNLRTALRRSDQWFEIPKINFANASSFGIWIRPTFRDSNCLVSRCFETRTVCLGDASRVGLLPA